MARQIDRHQGGEPHGISSLPMFGQYRVPWFVTLRNEKGPDFRIIEPERWRQAIREGLCWVCGKRLRHKLYAFPIGPMCTVNRVAPDPPSHKSCAIYSAVNCPFLNNPDRERRQDDLSRALAEQSTDWGAIKRNPGITAIWITRKFNVEPGAGDNYLCRLGEPKRVFWYCDGRIATYDEVRASYDSGCPLLEEMAQAEGAEAVASLRLMQHDAQRHFPKKAA